MSINFNIRIGCFEQTSMLVRYRSPKYPNFVSLVVNDLTLVYPKSLSATTLTINLDNVIEFYSEINMCGAIMITAYEDSMQITKLSNSAPTKLMTNPTMLNLTSGVFSPLIYVSYGGS
jgi:hypothetical protein